MLYMYFSTASCFIFVRVGLNYISPHPGELYVGMYDLILNLVHCHLTVTYYTLNVWPLGKTKLTSFPRDHTVSALLYI